MTTNLDAALYYASRSWPVFLLLRAGKTPLIPSAHPEGDPLRGICHGECGKLGHGLYDAVTDPAIIKEWWGKAPEANIGIATGGQSNLAVLDIDFDHKGEDSLAVLLQKNGDFPVTVTAKTGGGGRHFLFEMPTDYDVRNTESKIAQGIDTRGTGGYICAAPSLHPCGARYMWINPPSKTPLAKMPEWVKDMLRKTTMLEYPQTTTGISQVDGGIIAPGTRNATMASLAGTMRRRGMGEEAIYNALLIENKNKCVPMLSPSEIAAISKSVCRYNPAAAPILQNRDRTQMEWAFARAIYDSPINCQMDFHWLSPDLFADEGIRQYWQMVIDGRSVSVAAGEAGILLDLEKTESDPLNIDQYAKQISKWGYLSGVVKAAENLKRLAEVGDIERLEHAIEGLQEAKTNTPVMAKTAFDGLMELQNELDDPRQFIKTGLANFDSLAGGLARKKMSLLAARPSMGKTTLGFQIARNVAAAGQRVLFLSLEMAGMELWQKAAFGLAEINEADIQNKRVPPEKMENIRTEIIPELVQIYDGKLFIYDESPFSTMQLYKVAVNMQPDLIVIDHLRYVDARADNEVQRLGIISQWGKMISKKLNCHVMILAQLNRETEKRENKAPQLSDLRDSGQLEENADLVIMPYRASYYAADDPIKQRYSDTQLFIRKNRTGGTGIVGLVMDLLQQWFYRREDMPANYARVRLAS